MRSAFSLSSFLLGGLIGFFLSGIVLMVWILIFSKSDLVPLSWEVSAVKYNGIHVDQDWEPFGYDSEINVIYVKRQIKEE